MQVHSPPAAHRSKWCTRARTVLVRRAVVVPTASVVVGMRKFIPDLTSRSKHCLSLREYLVVEPLGNPPGRVYHADACLRLGLSRDRVLLIVNVSSVHTSRQSQLPPTHHTPPKRKRKRDIAPDCLCDLYPGSPLFVGEG